MSLPQTVPPEALEDTPIGSIPAGTLLGSYELGRLLGRGGMGAVYEGRHRAVNKRVAIKVLLPHLAASKSSTQRFLREAEAAGRVRHPHTVDVTDVGVSEGIPFLVMELLEGENLADRLDRVGVLPIDAAVDLALPVCSALATAHDEGVVHRDLKPENVFLARTPVGADVVKVLDFGISHIAQSADAVRLTATNSVIGTPRYMSPEQTKGARNADARSDQYSVGVMLYQCLTGSLPFDGDSFLEILEKMASQKVVPPSALREEIPSKLEAIVLRTLAKDPKKRFDSMRELGVALLPFASERGRVLWEPAFAPGARAPSQAHALPPQRDTTVKLSAERPRRERLVAAFVLAALCLGAGVAALWWSSAGSPPTAVAPDTQAPAAGATSDVVQPDEATVAAPDPGPVEPGVAPRGERVLPDEQPASREAVVEPRTLQQSGSTPRPRPRATPTVQPSEDPSARPAHTPSAIPDTRPRSEPWSEPAPRQPGTQVGPNGAVILR